MKKVLKIASLLILSAVLFPVISAFGTRFLENTDAMTSVPGINELKEGDIIFQTSQSQQSKYIQMATGSRMSHCGIIVKTDRGCKVLEASRTVRLTDLKDFIARGKDGKYWIKRMDIGDKKIRYRRYLGKHYDLAFRFDNNKYYCSELVYDIYLKQLDIELCRPKSVSSYCILGLDKILKRRGIDTSQKVVAPSDIYHSDMLENI